MNRLTAALLAVGLASSSATAFAQSSTYPPSSGYNSNGYNNGYQNNSGYQNSNGYQNNTGYQNNGYQQTGGHTDYARVIRVDPVLDGRYSPTSNNSAQRCYQTQGAQTAGNYQRDDAYQNGGYRNQGYGTQDYRNDGYRNDGYRSEAYRDPYGNSQVGNNTGRTIATVVGGIAGAVLGSKVGGGTGAYAATAIGSMVGGMAGRQVYDRTQQNRNMRPGVVTVCDPEPVRDGYAGSYSRTSNSRATAYDVTYEYNGRRYTRRMDYHPGERVRVRIDVAPQ